MENSAIKMVNIKKSFGEIVANEDVNFEVKWGQIHALLGENGAGKSTLMNIISGIYSMDTGKIYIDGKLANIRSPLDSINLGVGMIHQHFKLVENFTARENLLIGTAKGIITKGKVEKKLNKIISKYGFEIDLDKYVHDMSVSEKQTLEIIKVLYKDAKILILDEPTAVLTPEENEKLFAIMRNMKYEGHAIIIITHKLDEVMEISDEVTVLRKGRSIETLKTDHTNKKNLISMMVGKKMSLDIPRVEYIGEKTPLLEVVDVSYSDKSMGKILENVNLTVNTGEIVGVAGLAGNGQKQLCEIITGLIKCDSGKIIFEGEDITGKSPREIIKRKISLGFVPEDRLGMGLVASMDLVDNMLLKDYYKQEGLFISTKKVEKEVEDMVKELDIETPSIYHRVSKLSGGNIQKVLIGREVHSDPKLLITAYVVRGLDIGASYKIYSMLNEQKQKGVGVIFIGEDIDVLLAISDKIAVMSNRTMTALLDAKKTSKNQIGHLMAGGKMEELYA